LNGDKGHKGDRGDKGLRGDKGFRGDRGKCNKKIMKVYCGFIRYLRKELRYLKEKEKYLDKLIESSPCEECVAKKKKCQKKQKKCIKKIKHFKKKSTCGCEKVPVKA